jgi:hypothetical protein
MTVKISGQNYVTCLFIIPCLKSLQVAMEEVLCENDDDNSEYKIQIASTLRRSTSMNLDFGLVLPLVWDRRNALLPRKVNMMMALQQFDKNIQRLNKLNSQKKEKIIK